MAAFTALAIGSLALSAYEQIRSGRAAKKAGALAQEASASEAALSDYNASVAEVQATDAVERGAIEESRFRESVRGIIGSQRAAIGASGVTVGFGSALDVQADASYLGEIDALTIRTNAARESWGFKVGAFDLRTRAQIQRKEGANLAEAGKEAATTAYIGAASTIATGTYSLLQQKYGKKRPS